MRTLKIIVLITLVLILGSLTLFGQQAPPEEKNKPEVALPTEVILRRSLARRTVEPQYPEEAFKEGAQGLVIVAVLFDEEGDLQRAKVLESPHPAISRAVIDAIKQWKIRRLTSGGGLRTRVMSELRFNYVIDNGTPRVEELPLEVQKTYSDEFKKVSRQKIIPDTKAFDY